MIGAYSSFVLASDYGGHEHHSYEEKTHAVEIPIYKKYGKSVLKFGNEIVFN
jgi:hypothetical protein